MGKISKAVARVVLGPKEGRQTPGPTDAEIKKLLEEEGKK